jgi:hypothetical protein
MKDESIIDLMSTMLQKTITAISNELDELIINARWLGSIVLALIASLVGYQKLTGANKLSIPFALISTILGITLICFIIVTIVARYHKRLINQRYIEIAEKSYDILSNRDISPNERDAKIKVDIYAILKTFQSFSFTAFIFEILGLTMLVLSALISVFYIFIKEL